MKRWQWLEGVTQISGCCLASSRSAPNRSPNGRSATRWKATPKAPVRSTSDRRLVTSDWPKTSTSRTTATRTSTSWSSPLPKTLAVSLLPSRYTLLFPWLENQTKPLSRLNPFVIIEWIKLHGGERGACLTVVLLPALPGHITLPVKIGSHEMTFTR